MCSALWKLPAGALGAIVRGRSADARMVLMDAPSWPYALTARLKIYPRGLATTSADGMCCVEVAFEPVDCVVHCAVRLRFGARAETDEGVVCSMLVDLSRAAAASRARWPNFCLLTSDDLQGAVTLTLDLAGMYLVLSRDSESEASSISSTE